MSQNLSGGDMERFGDQGYCIPKGLLEPVEVEAIVDRGKLLVKKGEILNRVMNPHEQDDLFRRCFAHAELFSRSL